MVLNVKFDDFPEAVKKYVANDEVFVAEVPGGVAVTAHSAEGNILVRTLSTSSLHESKNVLRAAGLKVLQGNWSSDQDDDPLDQVPELYVASVAYRSREFQPGVWVDAYPYQPTTSEVLQSMYEEFVLNGEVKAVGFDEFLRLSQANVVILGPDQLKGFALQKHVNQETED